MLSRKAAEDLLVGGGDESDFVCGCIGGKFLGKPPGKGAASVIGEFAVGEREGLLRDDGLAAAITLGWVRRVEHLGKLALAVWLGKALEIETAVAGFLRVRIRKRIADGCQVEFIGEEKDAVAQDLGLHPPSRAAPEQPVLRVDLGGRFVPSRAHPIDLGEQDSLVEPLQ